MKEKKILYRLGVFSNMYPHGPEKQGFFLKASSGGSFVKKMVDELVEQDVDVRLAARFGKSIIRYIPFYIDSIKLCLKKDIKIFQAEYIPHSSIIPALLKYNRKLILRFHGDDGRIFPFKNKLNRIITQWMIGRSDYIITSSEEMREKLLEIGANPGLSAAISTGVDTSFFIPMQRINCRKIFEFPLDRIIFLFVGRFDSWKGISELIEAASYFPNDLFIFAGRGGIFPEHPDNCYNLGYIEPKSIPILMNAADCVVLPSYTEGLPNVLMEALSCAIPVITTDVGGCPEVVKDRKTGLIIPAKNVLSVVKALQWMKDHPSERREMGIEGRSDMMKRYELKKLIVQIIDIHKRVLKD